MPLISCPSCGTADALAGVEHPGGRLVACESCGHRWRRDLTPACRACGSTDLEAVATSTLEEAGRGEQRTPSGIRTAYRCWACGARDATSSSPVAAPVGWREQQRTGASRHRSARASVGDTVGDTATQRVETAFGVFETGSTVGGRWRLTALLRWSSTGSLWAATEVDGHRRVTFKLVHPHLAADGAAALHASSAQLVKGLGHAHLLHVFDVRRQDRDVLVVAEAVAGEILERVAHLPDGELTRLAAGLSDALATLHEHTIAHLDVRPAKVLLPPTGGARLVDLGSGRVRARTATRATDHRMAWQAPEQILAGRHGAEADVYSFGLTLWVAAGGRLDELGPNAPAQARYRMEHDLPPLASGAGTDDALEAAVTAATRRRPEDRPTARELAGLLAR